MGNREFRAIDLCAKGVDDREDGHASNGSRALDLEVVHLGEGRNEAMETAVAAGIVHFRGVSKKLTDRGYPRFVDSPVVRSVVEWAKLNGDSAAAASIWESRMNRSRSNQSSRNGQYPKLYGIGAQQGFSAGIGHLEL